jgi:dTDP-4-amino-4,6-dideoxygalactose transaminase
VIGKPHGDIACFSFHLRSWQSYCVWLPAWRDQRTVMQAMLDAGVANRRGVMCAHREPAYADLDPGWLLPESEKAQDHSIVLPLYQQMTEEDQNYVAEALREACQAS